MRNLCFCCTFGKAGNETLRSMSIMIVCTLQTRSGSSTSPLILSCSSTHLPVDLTPSFLFCRLKLSGEQIDDRIVEVHWDPTLQTWRMMRFRDDKPHGNHQSVVENIIQSIADGVERDALLARSNAIRNAWKARQGQPPGPPGPPSQQQQQQQRGPPGPPPVGHYQQQQGKPRPLPTVHAEIRYGPLASSPWSKVAGPERVCGMRR